MLKREFSRREKTLLVIFAVLMLVLLYYFLVDQPVRNTMEDASLRLENANSQIMIDELLVADMHSMQAALDTLDMNVVAKVPDYDNARAVVNLLNQALLSANAYDLNFRSVVSSGQIVARPIDINFSCTDYTNAIAIMSVLHDGPYYCQISAVTMTDAGGTAEDGSASLYYGELKVSMTITFYEYLPLDMLGE